MQAGLHFVLTYRSIRQFFRLLNWNLDFMDDSKLCDCSLLWGLAVYLFLRHVTTVSLARFCNVGSVMSLIMYKCAN